MQADIYLDLLEKVLTDYHRIDFVDYTPLSYGNLNWKRRMILPLDRLLRKGDFAVCKIVKSSPEKRLVGADWPSRADTMIGLKRLKNLRACIIDVVKNNVPGDLIETGVWRGGATIYMRAVLKALDVHDRKVWVADSFEGLPKPDEEKYPQDRGDTHHEQDVLRISLETVKQNFAKYDLLDDQVAFLKGWFKDTLPTAPIKALSVLRLDGDMYESTMDGLVNLYPKLSVGGYIIVDDYGAVRGCKRAVEDFRRANGIQDEIKEVDWTCVYWKKSS